MKLFGFFKGMPYNDCNEEFDDYRTLKNTLPKDKVYEHMVEVDLREKWRTSLPTHDIFTGERLTAGLCIDGEYTFPLDFLHYYKNYDIGIPYDYEEYLKSVGVGE